VVCYRRVKSAKPSGTTEDDIRDKSCDEYLDSYGKPFLFKHCLDYLWTVPKFDPMVVEEEETEEVVQLDDDEDDDDDDDDDQPVEVTKTKRLEGVNRTLDAMGAAMSAKVAKAQLKDERSYLTETANSKAAVMEKISITQDKIADTLATKNRFHEMKSLRENYQFYYYKEIGDTVAAEECLKALAGLRKIQPPAPPPPPQPSTPVVV
jgi:hypothetical protein